MSSISSQRERELKLERKLLSNSLLAKESVTLEYLKYREKMYRNRYSYTPERYEEYQTRANDQLELVLQTIGINCSFDTLKLYIGLLTNLMQISQS